MYRRSCSWSRTSGAVSRLSIIPSSGTHSVLYMFGRMPARSGILAVATAAALLIEMRLIVDAPCQQMASSPAETGEFRTLNWRDSFITIASSHHWVTEVVCCVQDASAHATLASGYSRQKFCCRLAITLHHHTRCRNNCAGALTGRQPECQHVRQFGPCRIFSAPRHILLYAHMPIRETREHHHCQSLFGSISDDTLRPCCQSFSSTT